MSTVISAIFIFLMVIVIHELGHFTVAKLVGIRVNEFSIGMGPKLYQREKGETKYTLRLLPIGGYVQMEGEEESSEDPRSFSNVPVLSRMAVVVSGAIMNFILAIVVLSIVSYGVGMPLTKVEETRANSPAEIAGIQKGDEILRINGNEIEKWEDIVESIDNSDPKNTMELDIQRDDKLENITLQPVVEENRIIIGIMPYSEQSIQSAIKGGFQKTGEFLRLMFEFIGMLFQGNVGTDDLAGPVGVVQEISVAAELGIFNVLFLLGFISVNLGFFNLLPVPALDGSKLIFLLIELVRGKPIDPNKEGIINLVGFVLLIGLMIVVTYKDIIRIGLN